MKKILCYFLIFIILFSFYRENKYNLTFTTKKHTIEEYSNTIFQSKNTYLNNPFGNKTINLNKYTISPYKFGTSKKDTIEYEFLVLLRNLIPFDIINFHSKNKILELVHKNFIQLGIVTEDMLNFYNIKNYKNIFFVCGTNYVTFTLITHFHSNITNWADLKNKRIGTTGKETHNYKNLKQLLKTYRLDNDKITIVNGDSNTIHQQFINKEIDAAFYTISHPNPLIILYEKSAKIKLIGTPNIDTNLLNFYIPNTSIQPINTIYYNFSKKRKKFIFSYGIRSIIIANKSVEPIFIYKLLYSFIRNILNLKSGRIYLNDLSISLITYTKLYTPIHPGALKFLTDYSFITDNENHLCDLFYGKNKCTKKKLENIINNMDLSNNITSKSNRNVIFGNETYILGKNLNNN